MIEILRPKKKKKKKGIVYGAKKHKRYPPVLDIINGLKQDLVFYSTFPDDINVHVTTFNNVNV